MDVLTGRQCSSLKQEHLSYLFIDSLCYDIKPVRKEEGKSYWKIPLCDDDATREK